MTYLLYALVILGGYLLGSSNMALYISKLKKVNMTENGSCNLGASNALLLMGWKAGVLVGVHDIGKGWLATVLAMWLCPGLTYAGVLAGAACVLGHIFPFYLGFKGGKGFAAYLGMALGLDWEMGVILLISVALIAVFTDYIVLGTGTTVISLPICMGIMTADPWMAIIPAIPTLVILYKHRENFRRIKEGTEFKAMSVLIGKYRKAPDSDAPEETQSEKEQ